MGSLVFYYCLHFCGRKCLLFTKETCNCFYYDLPCYAETWPPCFSHHQNIALWPRYVGYSLYYNHTYKRVISVAFNCISNFVVLHMHDRTNHSFIPLPRQGDVFPIETSSNILIYMVALLQKKTSLMGKCDTKMVLSCRPNQLFWFSRYVNEIQGIIGFIICKPWIHFQTSSSHGKFLDWSIFIRNSTEK